jgi:hypothetical protein
MRGDEELTGAGPRWRRGAKAVSGVWKKSEGIAFCNSSAFGLYQLSKCAAAADFPSVFSDFPSVFSPPIILWHREDSL